MSINASNIAAANAVGITNQAINFSESLLKRKIVLIGVADATKLSGTLVVNEPVRVFSAGEVGAIAGAGTMIHRLAVATENGSGGTEMYIIPQAEGGSDVAATGEIVISASSVESGTLALYLNGQYVGVSIPGGSTPTEIGDLIVTRMGKDTSLPVTGVNTAGTVALTAVSKGAFGNDISIATNLGGEKDVVGVTLAVTAMAGGSGIADIEPALTAMGIGDNANELSFTALQHGYGDDPTTLNLVSAYVGEGNTTTGCYDKLNGRVFRSLNGSIANDLSAEITKADARKFDRANGIIVVPNSPNHPAEFAANAMANMERLNGVLAQNSYFSVALNGVFAGDERWCDDGENRELAVRSGISPTVINSGAVVMQNVITYYRPDSVAVANNGYRSMRNISIVQNILYVQRQFFGRDEWTNITIVQKANRVTSNAARRKARDIQSVKDAVLKLGETYLGNGWLYSLEAVTAGLAKADSVEVRSGGTGFDYNMELVFSGEGGILNGRTIFDINIGVN